MAGHVKERGSGVGDAARGDAARKPAAEAPSMRFDQSEVIDRSFSLGPLAGSGGLMQGMVSIPYPPIP